MTGKNFTQGNDFLRKMSILLHRLPLLNEIEKFIKSISNLRNNKNLPLTLKGSNNLKPINYETVILSFSNWVIYH